MAVSFWLNMRVAVMVKVSLGCRRLAHSLFSAPASMTAGMVTMNCLQPRKQHKCDAYLTEGMADLMDVRNVVQRNSRSACRSIDEDPVEAKKQRPCASTTPRQSHDWLTDTEMSWGGHYIVFSALPPYLLQHCPALPHSFILNLYVWWVLHFWVYTLKCYQPARELDLDGWWWVNAHHK